MDRPDKIKSVRDIPPELAQVALAFLAAGGSDPERYARAARHTGIPAGVLKRLERIERGLPEVEEPPLPDDTADMLARAVQGRPQPPEEMIGRGKTAPMFVPAPEVTEWMVREFISREGALFSESHKHLKWAPPRVLWTNVPFGRAPQRVAGTAEMPEKAMKGNPWAKAQRERQLLDWFGAVPTFLITLDTDLWQGADDRNACATARHELLHCGQALDKDGFPKVNEDTGMPIYAIRRHDVEAFVEEGADFGVGASPGASVALFEAWQAGPRVSDARIAKACGTCRR